MSPRVPLPSHEPELTALVTALDRRLAQLKETATRFRLAIERCNPNRLTICMKDFPRGSCGDATPLLGTFLEEQGFGSFVYALGLRADDGINRHHSHAWMEADGIIVDITADQFPEVDQKVIVTQHSAWHATFTRDEDMKRERQKADYRVFDEHTVNALENAYQTILAEMERV